MLIRELEAKTGLDRAAIRFYEREGLITPERLRNSYRDYSQEDTDALLKIRLLRQLGTGLDQIQKLQQGSGELNELVQVQIELLDVQKNTLDAAKSICTEIRDAGISYNTSDAVYYLERLQNPSVSNPKSEFKEKIPRQYHPWRRYLARTLDHSILGIAIRFLLIVVLRIRPLGVFPGLNPRKHHTRQAVWKDVKRAAEAFRLRQNVGPHSARKVYAVELLRKYGDIEKVRKALNHSSDSVTLIYAMADQQLEAKYKRRRNAAGRKKS